MDESVIKEIISTISDEKAVLGRLISLSEQKKAFIIGGDVKRLNNMLKTEEALSYEFDDLESRRMMLTNTFARRTGLSGGKLTLLQIAETAEEPETREKLHALRTELLGMLKKQERYNRTNRELLKRKMNYIDVMLGVMLREEPLGETYDCTGSMGTEYRSTGLFDRSV